MATEKVTGAVLADDAVTTAKILDASVTTDKLADDAVTLAKLASGTDGELITWDASGDPAAVAAGTSGQILTSNGAGAAPTFQPAASSPITLAAEKAASSGTTVDFTSLPSGLNRITVMLEEVSCSTSNDILVQFGVSGTPETTGYDSASQILETTMTTSQVSTTGFIINTDAGADAVSGSITFNKKKSSTNVWVCQGVLIKNGTEMLVCSGYKALAGEVDTVRLTVAGGNFDGSGSVSINYQ